MQGTRLARIAQEAIEKLRVEGFLALLTPLVTQFSQNLQISSQAKDQFSELTFRAREALYDLSRDPDTKALLEALGIDQFFEAQNLGRLVAAFHAVNESPTLRAHPYFGAFRDFVANLQSLTRLGGSLAYFLLTPKLEVPEGHDIVELEVFREPAYRLSVGELTTILQVIEELHDAISRAIEIDATARIAYIESGSNVVVAIITKAGAALAIGRTLSQWWTAYRYRELADFDRKMESVAKGVDILDRLSGDAAKEGDVGEAARILRHAIWDDMIRLTGLGVKLADPKNAASDRPLIAAKRDPKLLKAAAPEAPDPPPVA